MSESRANGSPVPKRPKRKFRKSVTLDPDKVAQLGLKPGKNVIAFSFSSRVWGRQEVQAHAYLWDWNAKIVVSDVDGTITKSDLRGHVAAMVGKDWNHEGVAQLYNNIRDNGYQLMFLSSRAISHSKGTRKYLEKLTQDGETLTQGPVMLAPDPLSTALYREVVVRRPQEFKMRCLRTIRELFPADWNPFYAGFGNRRRTRFLRARRRSRRQELHHQPQIGGLRRDDEAHEDILAGGYQRAVRRDVPAGGEAQADQIRRGGFDALRRVRGFELLGQRVHEHRRQRVALIFCSDNLFLSRHSFNDERHAHMHTSIVDTRASESHGIVTARLGPGSQLAPSRRV